MKRKSPSSATQSRVPDYRYLILFACVLAAYLPAINGALLWDDDLYITRAALQSFAGLKHYWFQTDLSRQYVPVLYSALWLEHRLWGGDTPGYHLVNIALHALSACFVVRIMRRLELPGAWIGGFIFALHPVFVESVAWIAEQKTVLAGAFCLGAALTYLGFDQTRRGKAWWTAFALYVLAVLTKTGAGTLPAALLPVLWWRRGSLNFGRDVKPLLPWFAIAIPAGFLAASVEGAQPGIHGPEFALGFGEHCLLAGRALFFYLSKLLLPLNLTFIYPRWTVDSGVWWQYCFPVAALAVTAVCAFFAKRNRGPLTAWLFFVLTLFPVLGFVSLYSFRYSWVADRFQYLAALGLIVPLAALLSVGVTKYAQGHKQAVRRGEVACLVLLGFLSFCQAALYADSKTLYTETLSRNPECWLAHVGLGRIAGDSGDLQGALTHYRAALAIKPLCEEAHLHMGFTYLRLPGKFEDAVHEFEASIRVNPDYAEGYSNLGAALLQRGPGYKLEAVQKLETAVRLNPLSADARTNYAVALAGIPGRQNEALRQADEAVRLNPFLASAHSNRGLILTFAGSRFAEVLEDYKAAARLSPRSASAHYLYGAALQRISSRQQEAAAELREALRLSPGSPQAEFALGVVLSRMPGATAEAIVHLEASLRSDPTNEKARQLLASLRAGPK